MSGPNGFFSRYSRFSMRDELNSGSDQVLIGWDQIEAIDLASMMILSIGSSRISA